MARLYPLFSSSQGNSVYVGNSESGILIDVGVSYTRLLGALSANEIPISAVKGIFITHIHGDHISGLKTLTKKHNISVYGEAGTLDYLFENGYIYSDGEDLKGEVDIGDMKVTSFKTPHDTPDSCGYRIVMPDGRTCGVCTDLGCVTDTVEDNLTGCDLVYIESNYDEKMLNEGRYPHYLKSRIRSPRGHLSNKDCGLFASHLVKNGTTRLVLGHLSQENNLPDVADFAVESQLAKSGFERNCDYILSVAPPQTAGGFVAF